MIAMRKSEERGRTQIDWLDSRHTFSFGEYYDPRHMGYRTLRVINDDRVAPGGGFGTHPHRDMEIVTIVLDGALEHKDSLGTGSVIRPGDVQRMSAGAGIRHSEFNHSETEAVHFLQIWILPDRKGLEPSYEQKTFATGQRNGGLTLVAAPKGGNGALTIHQDVNLYLASLKAGTTVRHSLKAGRHAWVQVATGSATLNGELLQAGDGAAIENEPTLELGTSKSAEVLVFDLA